MTKGITFQTKVHFRAGRNGRKHLETGTTPALPVEPGRVPRVSRMMALAIRFDGLVRQGVVADQAELARLGHVTRARVTQIMNLLQLAPDIQENLLFLPRIERGKEPIQERQLRPTAAVPDWRKQRRMWAKQKAELSS
jgi:hypothetical protein